MTTLKQLYRLKDKEKKIYKKLNKLLKLNRRKGGEEKDLVCYPVN